MYSLEYVDGRKEQVETTRFISDSHGENMLKLQYDDWWNDAWIIYRITVIQNSCCQYMLNDSHNLRHTFMCCRLLDLFQWEFDNLLLYKLIISPNWSYYEICYLSFWIFGFMLLFWTWRTLSWCATTTDFFESIDSGKLSCLILCTDAGMVLYWNITVFPTFWSSGIILGNNFKRMK